MKSFTQHISLLAVSVFTVGVLAVVPVSAQTDVTPPTETATDKRAQSGERVKEALQRVSDKAKERADERSVVKKVLDDTTTTALKSSVLQEKAQKLVSEERAGKPAKTLEARQKACEARKGALATKLANYNRNSLKHLEVFDGVYDKIEAYQAEKQLTAADYDTLKAAVDAKRAAVVAAVEELGEVNTEVDCTAEDPAVEVAALKTAVSDVRSALHEYRLSIKDLVVALRTAASETANTTEGAN